MDEVKQVITAMIIYLAARYLLELSTPEKDYRELMATGLFDGLHWYRGREVIHQVRGWWIGREARS